ncbi:MAG: hypothetical protein ABJC39_11820 [Chloroflexota bacterium]
MISGIPIQPSDDRFERMLAERAGFDTSGDMVGTIVAMASRTPQRRRGWLWPLDAPQGRALPLGLAAALLALAILVTALALVGSDPFHRRSDLTVVPPPSPTSGLVAMPSGPANEPASVCGSTPPTDAPRVTTIDLPANAYAGMTFAACSVWILNNENGIGIHRVDVASNKVTDTVLNGPIDRPVGAIASNGDEVWAIQFDQAAQRQSMIHLDAVTGAPSTTFGIPRASLGSGFWIVGQAAWVGPDHRLAAPRDLDVIDLATGRVVTTLKDLAPSALWKDADAVWAIAPGATPEASQELVRIDPATFEVTRLPIPWQAADVTAATTVDDRGLFVAGSREIVQVSPEQPAVVRRIPLEEATAGALLASTGSELWAIPIRPVASPAQFETASRGLVQIDSVTGSVLQRIPYPAIGLASFGNAFRYAYGSLWFLAPDNDYGRTFGMHLVRVELPAAP